MSNIENDVGNKKVLIISPNSFGGSKGGSVLMRNLFGDWSQELIMSIHTERLSPGNVYIDNDYKVLGKRPLWTYPKRLIQFARGKVESGDGVFWFVPTDELKEKIKSFAPDFIYTQLGPPFMMKMVLWISEEYEIPIISHVMDDFISDWPISGHESRMWLPFSSCLNKRAEKVFEKCLSCSSVRLVISPSMAREYGRRYRSSFDVLSNGADINFWQKARVRKASKEDAGNKRIVFAGSISENTNLETISMVVDAVENLHKSGVEILFSIASHKMPENLLNKVNGCEASEFIGPLKFEKMPRFLGQAKLVVLPFNFDKMSIGFCKYSWPTKLAECLATGTPVLYVGPSELGFSQYLEKNEAAICSYSESVASLAENIYASLKDEELLSYVSSNAQKIAREEFSVEVTRYRLSRSIKFVVGLKSSA